MTRPIKFRAWSKKGMSMIPGLPVHSAVAIAVVNHRVDLLTDFQSEDDEWIIMQFTGLHDRHGKEIYEGDITTSEIRDEPKVVEFWEGCFCHKWDDGRGHIFNPKRVEIIGNIYENPELLK